MKRYDINDMSPCINDDGSFCDYKQWCKDPCKEYKQWARRKKKIVRSLRDNTVESIIGLKCQKKETTE